MLADDVPDRLAHKNNHDNGHHEKQNLIGSRRSADSKPAQQRHESDGYRREQRKGNVRK